MEYLRDGLELGGVGRNQEDIALAVRVESESGTSSQRCPSLPDGPNTTNARPT